MFFQSINTMMAAGTDLSINIRKVGEQLVVATLPRNNNLKDGSQSYLIPLTVSGSPMELDAGYLQAIAQPIQKAGGLLMNLEQFEKQAEKAASKAKTEKPKADNEANDAKAKRENYDKCLKKADELAASKRFSEALTSLKEAKTFATPMQQADLAKKIKTVELELTQGSLFTAAEEPTVKQELPVQQQIQQPQPMQQPQQQMTIPKQAYPQQPIKPMQQPQQQTFQQPTYPQQPVTHPQPTYQPGYPQQQPAMQTQPTAQPQPLQQPVIHPAQFSGATNGQPFTEPAREIPASQPLFRQGNEPYQADPVQRQGNTPYQTMSVQQPETLRQQPVPQPDYAHSFRDEKEEDTVSFREDPYAGYPDFPQEYRMRDEAQLLAAAY